MVLLDLARKSGDVMQDFVAAMRTEMLPLAAFIDLFSV
jgi:hypothetical protein